MSLFQTIALELHSAFTTDKRHDGDRYTKRKDDGPAWVTQALVHAFHEAIDDRMPDDWIYEQIPAVAFHLSDYADADEAREAISEIADGLVDIYNGQLLHWLSDYRNACLADEAAEELEPEADCCRRAQLGQYMALERLACAIVEAIEEEAAEREAEDPDDDAAA